MALSICPSLCVTIWAQIKLYTLSCGEGRGEQLCMLFWQHHAMGRPSMHNSAKPKQLTMHSLMQYSYGLLEFNHFKELNRN